VLIKNIPNLITFIRLLLAFVLLLVAPLSINFYVIYTLCGISDFLDGQIARKFNLTSTFGQILDSFADLVFISISLFQILPNISLDKTLLYWITIIAVIRLISIIIGFSRYHQITFLHTIANKVTGLLLFFSPLFIIVLKMNTVGIIICLFATISALEELLINLTSQKLNRDIKSIFHTK
jgi:CDP-diacylglycerol--glycerol-3-phosphate 3-phosphatidyltransferase